ncbi:XrtA/PEP-CTERM system TPR-repeat protein PrsT [Pelagibius marinus]|uniref:XrtA/PEP-CTERM system TPR-repeat protein PrsT n=1 Tax=Pelagibius marinus TaxID=2762760 RepID=UPI001872ECCA|nr:XrtA/PEP-CTERM system TPR-repeat protein PrsT [Pelagibius marinus]
MTLLLGSFLLFGAAAFDQAAAQSESYRRAQQYLESGDTAAALIEIKNALQADSNSAPARILLGEIYLKIGDPQAAETAFLRARELGADDERLDLMIAYARLGQGAFSEVLSEATGQAGGSTPVQRDLIVARGDALLALQKVGEAEEAYDSVLALAPHALAYRGKAAIALARQQPEKSRKLLDRALALEPENADIITADAEMYFRDGKYDIARQRFERAVELNPILLLPRLGVIRAALAEGDVKGALAKMTKLKAAQPNSGLVLFQDSVVQLAAKNFEAAKRSADEVLAINRYHTMALNVAGISAYSLGLYEQAAARLTQYLQTVPEDRQARIVLSATFLELKDVPAAKATLRPLLTEQPRDAKVLAMMGTAEALAGNTDAAIQYLDEAVAASPEDAVLRSQLGLVRLGAGRTSQMVAGTPPAAGSEGPTGTQASGTEPNEVALILGLLRAGEFDLALENAQRLLENEPDSPRLLVLTGLAHLGRSEKELAEKAFSRAVDLDPASTDATLNLARLKAQDGDLETAETLLQGLVARQPDNYLAMLDLSSLAGQSGNVRAQADWLERAVAAQPTLPTPRLRLALLYLHNQAALKALEAAEPGLAQNPDSREFLGVVGQAQLQAGQTDEAISTFGRLVELAPEAVEAHYLLARAYGLAGKHAEMKSQLNRALEIDPKHLPSQVALVRFLVLDGELEQARREMAELKAAHPDNPEVLAQEGWMDLRQGDAGAAARLLQAALDRSGLQASRDLVENLAQAHWRARNWDASVAVREDWLDRNPKDVPMLLAVAQSYAQLGRVDDATTAFRAVHSLHPGSVLALNNLAWLLQKAAPDEALEYAEEANRLAPGTPWVMDTLGWLLLERGDTLRAKGLFADAAAKAPENPQYRYHLAQALGRSGQKDEARQILEALLLDERLASDHDKIRGMLQQVGD